MGPVRAYPTSAPHLLILAAVGYDVLDLARGDAHDVNGVTDHVGGALLAFRSGGLLLFSDHR